MGEPDIAPAKLNASKFYGLFDHVADVGQTSVGFAALHKRAHPLDDLTGALGLLGCFFKGAQ